MQQPHEFEDTIETARPELTAEETAALWSRIAERTSTPASPIPSPYWFSIVQRTSMTPFIIALMLLVGAGGTVAASEAARPGDLLFPVERATERARLAIASDDRKESLRATFADKRLEELRSIIGDENENDDDSADRVAVSAEGEVRISNAINALVDILEEIETDEERERIFAALIAKVETIEVKNRGTIQVQSDDDNNARIKIKDDRIEIRDGAYRLRLNNNGEVIIRDNDDDDQDDDSDDRSRDDDDDDDDNRNDDNDSRTGIDEIEVEVEGGVAKIELDYNNDEDESYTIPFTTKAAVVANIASRTGLTEAAVAAMMEFKMDDSDDDDDSNDDSDDRDDDSSRDDDDDDNRNDDDRDDDDNRDDSTNSTSLKELEAEVEGGLAKVKVAYQNGREDEFSLPFVSETALVASIALRTGLSQTVVNGALDVEYDD